MNDVKADLAHSPELSKQADALLGQFSSIRSRDSTTYAAILAATAGPSDDLMTQVGALGKWQIDVKRKIRFGIECLRCLFSHIGAALQVQDCPLVEPSRRGTHTV